MNENNLLNVFKNFNQYTDSYLGALFINIYNKYPHTFRVYYDINKVLQYIDTVNYFGGIRKEVKYKINIREFLKNISKKCDTYNISVFCYSPNEFLVLGDIRDDKRLKKTSPFLINVTLSDDEIMENLYEDIFCCPEDIDTVFNILKDLFVISDKESKIEFGITAADLNGGLYTSWYQYNEIDIDIKKNYNDDLPYDRICDIIEQEGKPSLLMFYGEPGTGKSSLIKHLIFKYKKYSFIFIDESLLENVQKEKLMSYFIDNKNTIFILEDCEEILKSRERGNNSVLPVLLNVTDGILGDALGIKLLCTFNTNINKIDNALIRKGRMSLKYEFKKLSIDKTKALLEDNNINEPMTLADIYYYKEENDYSKKATTRIGF